ncbi:MAG: Ig-like domain-containing protein [Candidatus Cyclobacteriaceae bacterium M2_1C_046]
MKRKFPILILIFTAALLITGCEETTEDVIPPQFFDVELRPDDIYMYNAGSEDSYGVRLDPLLNDSIRVSVNVTYSDPQHGIVYFLENEGSYYKPDPDFLGIDSLTYTVCSSNSCKTEKITMIVEAPLDWENCSPEINEEHVITTVNTPIEIRIFLNDVMCGFNAIEVRSPEKGTFTTYSYSGTYKNTVYVYHPPRNFTGTDSFKYRVWEDYQNDPTNYHEAISTVTVN